MGQFGLLERYLGRLFDSMPKSRQFFKKFYQKLNYIIFKQRGFQCQIQDELKISKPSLPELGKLAKTSISSFFGYYDKCPWNRKKNAFLYHEKGLMKDLLLKKVVLDENAKVTLLGNSNAWNFQQGAMLQWLYWNDEEIIAYNVCEQNQLGCRLSSGYLGACFCPWPIQTAHPFKPRFLSLNFLRLNQLRPEYGYNVVVDNFTENTPDSQDGLWQIAWPGKICWFVSLDDLKKKFPRPEMQNSHHKVNHAIYSPKGKRIIFMHRWIGASGKFSRLYSIDDDGTNLRLLLDNRMVSHYNWKNDDELIAWARNDDGKDCYLHINAETGEKKIMGEGVFDVFGDGHPSFSPCGRYVVTDTYPDRRRQRSLLIFDIAKTKVVEVGRFFEPLPFIEETRCDLHPRWSPDGEKISIDSAHSGERETYIIENIRAILHETFC